MLAGFSKAAHVSVGNTSPKYSNIKQAAILGISHRTVEFHKYRIMQAVGARTNAELVRYAIGHGLVQSP